MKMNCEVLYRRSLTFIVLFMMMVAVAMMLVPVVCGMLENGVLVVMRRITATFVGMPDRRRNRPPRQQRG